MVCTARPSQATASVRHDARRRAIDEDRAGAAHAVLAAEMRAGEIAPLAQEIGED